MHEYELAAILMSLGCALQAFIGDDDVRFRASLEDNTVVTTVKLLSGERVEVQMTLLDSKLARLAT
jgi:hypothetical protein